MNTKISNLLDDALFWLEKGDCIGLATETVYGLAADACKEEAVHHIFKIKGRPAYNPLIIHVDSLDQAMQWGVFSNTACLFAEKFWGFQNPSPLTLVVKKKEHISSSNSHSLAPSVTAGLDTVGIRIPAHPLARKLLQDYQKPLAAPSANKSMYISPTTAQAVFDDLNGLIPFILDGGPCVKGLESTILDVSQEIPMLLRLGSTDEEALKTVVPDLLYPSPDHGICAPGMMKKHYSPNKPLRLNAEKPLDDETYLGFGAHYDLGPFNLSPSGNISEAASCLYHLLRHLDSLKTCVKIAVAPIPHVGLGCAINDRLHRAACEAVFLEK